MSTSPSWFDQEKFSRLVKKVGPKPAPEAPGQPGGEMENRSPSGEGLASTARISLVSKPPSLLAEQRALPALPRRTSPLPSLKALFPNPPPRPSPSFAPTLDKKKSEPPPEEAEAKDSGGDLTGQEEEARNETGGAGDEVADHKDGASDGEELAEAWQKMGQLNEELARTILERDQAVNEGIVLREQLRQADEASEKHESAAGAPEDLSRVSEERDQARREYATLRKQFETLKQEQTQKEESTKPREESDKARQELEEQLGKSRQKSDEQGREIADLKSELAALKSKSGEEGEGGGKLKEEMTALREQLTRAKEDASVAQRGLVLSQKALRETRDTLREATEGTSLSRHNFDNLKAECAALVQQNAVLQAQNDQLSRELGVSTKPKTTRL